MLVYLLLPRDGANNIMYREMQCFFLSFQLTELEQRVLEAEGRAEEAEDKVTIV